MRTLRHRAAWLTTCLILAAGGVRAEDVSAVYAAILRGDYQSGRAAASQLSADDGSNPDVKRVNDWLDSFDAATRNSEELRSKTYEWYVSQSKSALEAGRTYLALVLASQAPQYAEDEKAIAKESWAQELTRKGLEEAAALRTDQSWSRLAAYSYQLERLNPDDKGITQLREDAERHARLEILYKDKKAVERRTEGVESETVKRALQLVDRNYYRAPDFKQMAEAALHNLVLACESPKLRETFDGLGNPELRSAFESKLKTKIDVVRSTDSFSYRNIERLYNEVMEFSRQTVELPRGVVAIEFMEGAISKLDPFTGMVWPADAREFDKQILGGFQGVGISLGTDERTHRLKVVTPLENSPALRAGIQPGDLIIEVNGESTKGWTSDDAVRNITGKAGTTVTLKLFRPSTGEDLVFPLVRSQITLTTVRGVNRLPGGDSTAWNYILDPVLGIAYVRLTNFNPDSDAELREAVKAARDQGMQALILDLRFNPGGLLDVAVETVSTFVRAGKEVVSTRGRKEVPELHETDDKTVKRPLTDLPMIVLVNEGSASAAEILSGAMQDHKRALVIGERTFGKGSVQKVLPIDDAKLRLTTALYYLPRGRSPHKEPDATVWGVEPDVAVPLTPKERGKIIERARASEIINNGAAQKTTHEVLSEEARAQRLSELTEEEDEAGKSGKPEKPLLTAEDFKALDSDPLKAPDADPQLETALLMLRVKIASKMSWPQIALRPDPQTRTP